MAKMPAGLQTSGGQPGLQVMCIGRDLATSMLLERIFLSRLPTAPG